MTSQSSGSQGAQPPRAPLGRRRRPARCMTRRLWIQNRYSFSARPQQTRRAGPKSCQTKTRRALCLRSLLESIEVTKRRPDRRLEQVFARHGVQITRRTLSEWNGAVADLLEAIVRVMHREQVRQSPWIQCDDTTLEVQDPSRAPEIRTAISRDYRSWLLGARPAVLQGSAADGGGTLRAGVGDHPAALRDRAGGQRQATRCARTTAVAARAGSADAGETASVVLSQNLNPDVLMMQPVEN